MAEKSRLIEKELKKRLDPTKIEIGNAIEPIGNQSTDDGAYLPPEKNFGSGQETKK